MAKGKTNWHGLRCYMPSQRASNNYRQVMRYPDSPAILRGEMAGKQSSDFTPQKMLSSFIRRNELFSERVKGDLADLLQGITVCFIQDILEKEKFTLTTAWSAEKYNACSRAAYRTLRDLGYLKKSKGFFLSAFGRDADGNEIEPADPHCVCGYGSVMPELCECGMDEKSFTLAREILDFYENHSTQETCERFGVQRSRKIEKALMAAMPKQVGAGKGGKRENAGRKKQRKEQISWNAEPF